MIQSQRARLALCILLFAFNTSCGGRGDDTKQQEPGRLLQLNLTGAYYSVPTSHPDFGRGVDGVAVQGLVQGSLGPTGLPRVSAFGKTYTGVSGPITDIDANDEIRWWSSTSPHGVSLEKTQTDALPLEHPTNFFPAGQSDNLSFMRTVHWKAAFSTTSADRLSISLGADDDAWVFIDGQLQVDNGGVKNLTFTQEIPVTLAPGNHQLDVFFADRHTDKAGIQFVVRVRSAN
jgi:fibro-slime domain-containing protein